MKCIGPVALGVQQKMTDLLVAMACLCLCQCALAWLCLRRRLLGWLRATLRPTQNSGSPVNAPTMRPATKPPRFRPTSSFLEAPC